jgi:uncharacterized membrane protein YqjE
MFPCQPTLHARARTVMMGRWGMGFWTPALRRIASKTNADTVGERGRSRIDERGASRLSSSRVTAHRPNFATPSAAPPGAFGRRSMTEGVVVRPTRRTRFVYSSAAASWFRWIAHRLGARGRRRIRRYVYCLLSNMDQAASEGRNEPEGSSVLDLLRQVRSDLEHIVKDELTLAELELEQKLKHGLVDLGAMFLSALLMLIGLCFLCVSVVPALAPLIAPLWLRLVVMAAVYLLIGGVVVTIFAVKFRRDASPKLHRTQEEAGRVLKTVRKELGDG